jgi:cellulose synthase/poly-beta-1,6-N-acetylglucosamine synthase-like glycosyltransferase
LKEVSEAIWLKKFLPGEVQNMDNEALVSVVTPFYYTANYLKECIQNVLGQTYLNWEYILVDRCSKDGSR